MANSTEGDDTCKMQIMKSVQEVKKKSWYWEVRKDKNELQKIFDGERDGSFIVRATEAVGCLFTLTFKDNDTLYNLRIQHSEGSFHFHNFPELRKPTILKLIDEAVSWSRKGILDMMVNSIYMNAKVLYPLSKKGTFNGIFNKQAKIAKAAPPPSSPPPPSSSPPPPPSSSSSSSSSRSTNRRPPSQQQKQSPLSPSPLSAPAPPPPSYSSSSSAKSSSSSSRNLYLPIPDKGVLTSEGYSLKQQCGGIKMSSGYSCEKRVGGSKTSNKYSPKQEEKDKDLVYVNDDGECIYSIIDDRSLDTDY